LLVRSFSRNHDLAEPEKALKSSQQYLQKLPFEWVNGESNWYPAAGAVMTT
jgi:hypothetical protein